MAKRIKDETIIEALLTSTTQKSAAIKLGISERTICERKKDESFMHRYNDARRERVQSVRNTLQVTAQNAAMTLSEIMQDKTAPASVRVSAASEILRQSARFTELGDVLERLKGLESNNES